MKKQIEDLKDGLDDFKEKNQFLSQREDMVDLLDKNNRVLMKTNEQLSEQINEMKFKQELLVKKFEDEVRFIREKLEFYRINLNKVCATVYEGNSYTIEN